MRGLKMGGGEVQGRTESANVMCEPSKWMQAFNTDSWLQSIYYLF